MNHLTMESRYITVLIFLSVIFSGCKEAELDISVSKFHLIRVFDDTLADANHDLPQRIISGNNRLYMIYGSGNPSGYYYSIYVPRVIQSRLMVTDNDGEIISRQSLPEGLSAGDILKMDDGSIVVAAFDPVKYSPPFIIHLFHFDQDGQLFSADSLELPATFGFGSFGFYLNTSPVNLCRSSQGNILVFGSYANQVMQLGFIAQCDVRGNLLWSRQTNLPLFCGVPTEDNGYLFNTYDYGTPWIYLMKTNASGDSLWTKKFRTKNDFTCTRQIIRTVNGNYQFCFNDNSFGSPANNPFYLYEVNQNGDSLNAIIIGTTEAYQAGAIVAGNDGSTFALMNVLNVVFASGVMNQLNTTYAKVDMNFKLLSKDNFQTESNDILSAACKTSDGRIACFGFIQSYDRTYFKPELIVMN